MARLATPARNGGPEAEALLVDEGWHAPEPEPVTAEPVGVAAGANESHDQAPERQRSLFSWAEFMVDAETQPPRPRVRREAPTLSLFEWALEQEREGTLTGAAR